MNENPTEIKGLTREERQKVFETDTILKPDSSSVIKTFIQGENFDQAKQGLAVQWELFKRHFPNALEASLQQMFPEQITPESAPLLETIRPPHIFETSGNELNGINKTLQVIENARAIANQESHK